MTESTLHRGQLTLDQIQVGSPAVILEVTLPGKDGRRILELGLIPGALVEVLGQGSSLLLRLGDHRLSLRKEAASQIIVDPLV